MLELKKICKTYITDDIKQKALDDVNLNFRKCEFASILGPSGSGKTTLLNIIGGLDHYDSGDLVINEVSTKKFKDADWDSYRNHRIGFVFQSYNLIGHQTVLSNVKLALTLSGISKKEATERAKKALKEVGLENHINKRPNQLSGGQMQRVAIARALVNNPEIILADEPTGALDSETSEQIMKVLKDISKDKLVIMVTHNPDLAKEYSTRIINLKDGRITSDSNPYDGKINTKENEDVVAKKRNKTKMKFLTALSLSFNNLMTKKARTILVALAGSIGIIGIALIMSVSTGFQNYVDTIQEETMTSYPLTILQESGDLTSLLLSMQSGGGESNSNEVTEQQNISNMLSSVSTNDLKSFKNYLEDNYSKIEKDIVNIKYAYSVTPNIYTKDVTKEIVKLNPSNLMSSMFGDNSLITSSPMSSFSSIYSEMVDNTTEIEEQYDVLKGRYPKNYDEAIIVLSDKSEISDLLVYSLGLRDYNELKEMVTNILSGKPNNINNEPLTFSYDDLMNIDLRVIMPTDTYKYNSKYDIYEDMSSNEATIKDLYDKALKLKIVGIVAPKEGSMNTLALSPGVNYTSALTKYIIDYSTKQDIVKKQLQNEEVDVFSGNKFTDKNNNFDFKFSDLLEIDQEKLKSAFNVNIDSNAIEKETANYMKEITAAITTDITPAQKLFTDNLNTMANDLFSNIPSEFEASEVDTLVNNYLNSDSVTAKLKEMESAYVIPLDTFKTAYMGLLQPILPAYVTAYSEYLKMMNPNGGEENSKIVVVDAIKKTVLDNYLNNAAILATNEKMARAMTEALMQKTILTKVGELTNTFTNSMANAFNIDQEKMASAFKLKYTQEELTRIISAMMNRTEASADSNLLSLGYQDIEKPTGIAFYFSDFDGKEDFLNFLDNYNDTVDEEQKINYTDTTGILMNSVKTIVNAVSYVLIAFVSISLVVSSIMIGVITYISVYERTKEIGILRAIGASKRNVSSIFNAETFIIGLLSGLLGIGISYALIPIINAVLHHFTGNIPLSAALAIDRALILVVLSIILTLIGGIIPARAAAKKDPVEALRSK